MSTKSPPLASPISSKAASCSASAPQIASRSAPTPPSSIRARSRSRKSSAKLKSGLYRSLPVTSTTSTGFGTTQFTFGGSNRSALTVDGLDNTARRNSRQIRLVISGSYSAEFGRAGGGVINVISRSGTNDLHGSGMGLYRPRETTARSPSLSPSRYWPPIQPPSTYPQAIWATPPSARLSTLLAPSSTSNSTTKTLASSAITASQTISPADLPPFI